ncbi:hypothetical protein P280DRAFT_393179 [Massarina eburnea CBS 473.64]|uniref:Ribosomal protein-like protein S15 n=1 Tax=Massarina eburnea CBS 473.64 TaxID=1395130 RepID=A0A6A6S8W0_9PLEO|nr:hypothetical protein P280DRAFT_393179 [Massarina eburnea CBS 473.64]
MPPRIASAACLRASNASLFSTQFTLPLRPFSATAAPLAKTQGSSAKQRTHDPYILAQQAHKKAANLSRRADLEGARVASMGDPVRGTSTPFVQSFATATPLKWDADKVVPKESNYLNYALKPRTVKGQLGQSEKMSVSLWDAKKAERAKQQEVASSYTWSEHHKHGLDNASLGVEPGPRELEEMKKKDHERATEAIRRITLLDNGSSKDRMKVNVARCVTTFGRHNTDRIMPPRAPPLRAVNSTKAHKVRPATNVKETGKRIGPDTGSSEVQIAILTAKIKTLADFLAVRGKGDKHNKRNLRLLVHRRQKLLRYLRRKERGGPRWQHCIETLGLTEGTWRGEISL